MTDKTVPDEAAQTAPKHRTQPPVRFRFIKSNAYRVIHSDGAWVGPTPDGYVSMDLYSERFPVPATAHLESGPDGTVTQVVDEDILGIVDREMDVAVILDLPTAKILIQLLGNVVQHLEKIQDADASKEQD